MANDRDQDQNQDQNDETSQQPGKTGRDRTIGKGMDSLDSTQAPLKAETGEPDWDAMTDRGGKNNPDRSNDSNR